ncbi:MAG: phenylacetic acid degradation bifunctional protein PaaZ [Paracoccaceae bacterium]
MGVMEISSFAEGKWFKPSGPIRQVYSAVTGVEIGKTGSGDLDFAAMRDYAITKGGAQLRQLTFHERAKRLKALAIYLNERRDALYQLSYMTGSTKMDSMVDIDGGIGTLFVYASKGRKEMPDGDVYVDGELEVLSKTGSFQGLHFATPLLGVSVHINAFNFPVWGMLEKLAPCLLAGMPAIVKPATDTSYLTQACFRIMIESGIFPEGSIQLIVGSTGNLLDLLDCQDTVGFTGSADTALKLRSNPTLLANSVRFVAEQDSLNASILAPDCAASADERRIFTKEVVREMTVKAGQKCTAIRRIIVPKAQLDTVITEISESLAKITIGDPEREDVRMGALASQAQRRDVQSKIDLIAAETEMVFGARDSVATLGDGTADGAFQSPVLFHCKDPANATAIHKNEAFGPVATVMAYEDMSEAIELANKGGGSLVASVVTKDASLAKTILRQAGPYHGRLYFNSTMSAREATGHGAPMPHMIHGGPGRAGGGEELGGIRAVKHYMQTLAVQGSPDILSGIAGQWIPGATETPAPAHPFTRNFHDLSIGETLTTEPREITMADIEHFAEFTGDTFYAHLDEEAAKANPFFPGRVAHGYLLLSFAAGLFVQPDPGPVLANTGLNALSFQKPVSPGDHIHVRLVVARKTQRTAEYGQVAWHVTLFNQDAETCATYELLTMNAYA